MRSHRRGSSDVALFRPHAFARGGRQRREAPTPGTVSTWRPRSASGAADFAPPHTCHRMMICHPWSRVSKVGRNEAARPQPHSTCGILRPWCSDTQVRRRDEGFQFEQGDLSDHVWRSGNGGHHDLSRRWHDPPRSAVGQQQPVLRGSFLQGLPAYSIADIPSSPRDLRAEEATPHRTDCTSTGGLVALNGAGPDTNRSAGLHSRIVVAIVARLKAVRVHLLPV